MILFWDFLVLVLVVFPLLTGGIWISRPGLFIELSDLAIPVLLVTIVGIVISLSGQSLHQSRVLQKSRLVWEWWNNRISRHPQQTLFTAAILVGCIWSLASLKRHWALGSHLDDLGVYVNGIWNYAFGNGYISANMSAPGAGMHLMGDHQSPSFLLLGPLYHLFPRAETLLIFQSFGLAMGGVALFYLQRQYYSSGKKIGQSPIHWSVYAAPLLYWAYLPIRNAYYSDFHPEVVLISALLWAIVGLQSTRLSGRLLGALAFLYGMGLKEAAPPVGVALGIAWLLGSGPEQSRRFTRFLSIPIIVVSLAIFYFDLNIVPSLYGIIHHNHITEYGHFGSSLIDVLLSPFTHPRLFWDHIFTKERMKFLFWTLAPLGFLPLFNPMGFIVALPGYLLLFLSNAEYRITTIFHYAIIPAIGLFYALPGAIQNGEKFQEKYLKKLFPKRPEKKSNLSSSPLWIWILFWALAANGRSDLFRLRDVDASTHAQWYRTEVIPALNPTVTLSAPDALVPHLANRREIYPIPIIQDLSGKPIPCLLLDLSIHNLNMDQTWYLQLKDSLQRRGYQKEYQCGSCEIYKIYKMTDRCLITIPPCLSP